MGILAASRARLLDCFLFSFYKEKGKLRTRDTASPSGQVSLLGPAEDWKERGREPWKPSAEQQ